MSYKISNRTIRKKWSKIITRTKTRRRRYTGTTEYVFKRSESDDDIKKYFDINDYREFVWLQNEFQDGVFSTNSSEYEKLKILRTKRSNNKKAGKTFNIYMY